jgi:hypothetical protein
MDTTTIVALIAVIIGPIALYLLRRGNVRSNGQFVELTDCINITNNNNDWSNTLDELHYDLAYSSLPGNINYSHDD